MDFYTWMEKDLKRLKRVNIFLGVILIMIVSFLIFIIFLMGWSISLEEYCRKEAQNIVGDKWNVLLDPNPDEYGFIPPEKGNKITLGFRLQLKCERSIPLFRKLN